MAYHRWTSEQEGLETIRFKKGGRSCVGLWRDGAWTRKAADFWSKCLKHPERFKGWHVDIPPGRTKHTPNITPRGVKVIRATPPKGRPTSLVFPRPFMPERLARQLKEMYPDPARALGNRLRAARKRRGLSQKELAARLGISVSFVQKIENSVRSPGADLLARVRNFISRTPRGDTNVEAEHPERQGEGQPQEGSAAGEAEEGGDGGR